MFLFLDKYYDTYKTNANEKFSEKIFETTHQDTTYT